MCYTQLFHQLCIENDEDFQCLLLHTEVRWLSKGNCLKRFYSLFNSVLDFFQESNPELYDKLKSNETDIAYLTEMFFKFNEVNLQLQGDETSLIKAKSALLALLLKLQLYSRNLGHHKFCQFPCLSDLEKKTGVKDDDIAVYWTHLAELHRDMSVRFNDLFSLEIPGWVIDPFTEPNKLNITERGDLRLLLANPHPDVDSLIAMHQALPSH